MHTHMHIHAHVCVMYMYGKCMLMILNKVSGKVAYLGTNVLGTIISKYLLIYLGYFFNLVIYLLPRYFYKVP